MENWLGAVKEIAIAAIWAFFLGLSVKGLGDLMFERQVWLDERKAAVEEVLGRDSADER